MATYRISFKPSVEKDLRRLLPSVRERVADRIEELVNDPFPRGATKLAGAEHLWRIRVGDYRVIYEVDQNDQVVVVYYVRHRRDAYRIL